MKNLAVKLISVGIILASISAMVLNILSIEKGRILYMLPDTSSATAFAESADKKLSFRPHHAGNEIALNQYYSILNKAISVDAPGVETVLTALVSHTTEIEPANLNAIRVTYSALFVKTKDINSGYYDLAKDAFKKVLVLRPLDETALRGLYCLYKTSDKDEQFSVTQEKMKKHLPAVSLDSLCPVLDSKEQRANSK
jgi:hypothetical protein